MPTSKRPNPTRAARVSDTPHPVPLDAIRQVADALCRTATECAHQHDRFARLLEEESSLPTEELAVQEICGRCDHSIAELAAEFERRVAGVHGSEPPAWWGPANTLWQASRDYARRHHLCDEMTRRLRGKHTPQQLWQLEIEFELEASALLSLRHACEAYHKARG